LSSYQLPLQYGNGKESSGKNFELISDLVEKKGENKFNIILINKLKNKNLIGGSIKMRSSNIQQVVLYNIHH
jgi:hypothetical protein